MRILSIDGGGLRGILPAAYLAQLEVKTGKPIAEQFDMVCGTSTGAILACSIAIKLPMSQVVDLYKQDGPAIFHRTLSSKIGDPEALYMSKYAAAGAEGAFSHRFGTKRLSDSDLPLICCSADLNTRQIVLFKSEKAKKDSTFDLPLASVVRASTAAPTYFPPAEDHLIDGGVWANNPSMIGLDEAISNCGKQLAEIEILSLGTGTTSSSPIRPSNYGATGWLLHLAEVFMGYGAEAIDHHCRSLIGDRYERVQWDLGSIDPAMDNCSQQHMSDLLGLLGTEKVN